jgi:cobalamin biosynthesis protein CobT
VLGGCLDHPLKQVVYDKTSEDDLVFDIAVNKDVDILFVIDNSGSMAEEQALLSANFKAFIDVLERDDVKANYRIGITTTTRATCGGSTSPEAALQFQRRGRQASSTNQPAGRCDRGRVHRCLPTETIGRAHDDRVRS